jgi:hypothetical protein
MVHDEYPVAASFTTPRGLSLPCMGGKAWVVVVALSCGACSDPDSRAGDPDGGGGGNTGGSASGGAGGSLPSATGGSGGGQACNDLELDAPAIGITSTTDPIPVAEGGTITEGKYFATAQIVHGTTSFPTDPFIRTRMDISHATWREVSGGPEPDGVNPEQRFTYTISTSGTALTLARVCPAGGSQRRFEYTATTDEITMFVVDRGTTVRAVFTKQ